MRDSGQFRWLKFDLCLGTDGGELLQEIESHRSHRFDSGTDSWFVNWCEEWRMRAGQENPPLNARGKFVRIGSPKPKHNSRNLLVERKEAYVFAAHEKAWRDDMIRAKSQRSDFAQALGKGWFACDGSYFGRADCHDRHAVGWNPVGNDDAFRCLLDGSGDLVTDFVRSRAEGEPHLDFF